MAIWIHNFHVSSTLLNCGVNGGCGLLSHGVNGGCGLLNHGVNGGCMHGEGLSNGGITGICVSVHEAYHR